MYNFFFGIDTVTDCDEIFRRSGSVDSMTSDGGDDETPSHESGRGKSRAKK
jgi:hypothetical protein